MTTAVQTTIRYIWKCRNKQCKHVWALEYSPVGAHNGVRVVDGKEVYISDDHNDLRCPACNAKFPNGTRVEGKYNPEKACNARCMGATSGACECSCGGENHGRNHL